MKFSKGEIVEVVTEFIIGRKKVKRGQRGTVICLYGKNVIVEGVPMEGTVWLVDFGDFRQAYCGQKAIRKIEPDDGRAITTWGHVWAQCGWAPGRRSVK